MYSMQLVLHFILRGSKQQDVISIQKVREPVRRILLGPLEYEAREMPVKDPGEDLSRVGAALHSASIKNLNPGGAGHAQANGAV